MIYNSGMKLSKNKSGLALGGLLGLFHALWCVLVVAGAAQWLLDFVFKLHFLNNPYVVGQFNLALGASLVVVTFVVGYVVGWVLTLLWNSMHK